MGIKRGLSNWDLKTCHTLWNSGPVIYPLWVTVSLCSSSQDHLMHACLPLGEVSWSTQSKEPLLLLLCFLCFFIYQNSNYLIIDSYPLWRV